VSLRAGLGHDLPRVPRRCGQWAGAVLFVLVSVLVAGRMWQQQSDREEVLAVATPVPAGAETTVEDVEDVEVAGPEDDSILAADSAVVIGSTAGFGLVDAGVGTEVHRHRTHAGRGRERHLVVGVVRKRGEPRSLPLV
jgi:hypothetical protein